MAVENKSIPAPTIMAVENKSIQVPGTIIAPEIVRPERKTQMMLMQEWPLSRKIATAAVLLIALVLSVILVMQVKTGTSNFSTPTFR
jgi:hypothetical protein